MGVEVVVGPEHPMTGWRYAGDLTMWRGPRLSVPVLPGHVPRWSPAPTPRVDRWALCDCSRGTFITREAFPAFIPIASAPQTVPGDVRGLCSVRRAQCREVRERERRGIVPLCSMSGVNAARRPVTMAGHPSRRRRWCVCPRGYVTHVLTAVKLSHAWTGRQSRPRWMELWAGRQSRPGWMELLHGDR